LKNAKNKNLLKIKRILITEIKTNRGPIVHILLARGGRRAPLPPVSYATGCDVRMASRFGPSAAMEANRYMSFTSDYYKIVITGFFIV